MEYQAVFERAAEPLREIQGQLRLSGVEMEIEQTGGWTMVGYVFLTDRGHAGQHLGITREGDAAYLVCSYVDEEDDGSVLIESDLGSAVDVVLGLTAGVAKDPEV